MQNAQDFVVPFYYGIIIDALWFKTSLVRLLVIGSRILLVPADCYPYSFSVYWLIIIFLCVVSLAMEHTYVVATIKHICLIVWHDKAQQIAVCILLDKYCIYQNATITSSILHWRHMSIMVYQITGIVTVCARTCAYINENSKVSITSHCDEIH